MVTFPFGAGDMSTCVFLPHAVRTRVRHPDTMRRLRERPELMRRCTL